MTVRLQKLIAGTGLASRRKAEELIISGRVTINGHVVKELGTKVDPERDHVKVDGKHLRAAQPYVYLILNKPKNVMSTLDDPEGRPTVKDFLRGVTVRVFPVGRLDFDSEGLMLLTNHGDLAQALLHPRYHVPKTYLIKVKGVLDDAKIETLERGVKLEDGFTAPAKINKVSRAESNSWLEVTIHEGRKHQVKRMIEAVGHSVIKLTRIRMGPLLLGDLAVGEYRFLTDREANRLRELVEDRVARAERPELDASGKPVRWMPPTEPAPPRPPKPERSGRGPKSQRQESGPRSQRNVESVKPGRSGRGVQKRPLSPGAKFRRPAKTAFQRPQPGVRPQGDDRFPLANPADSVRKPRPSGSGFQRGSFDRKPQGAGRGTAGNRSSGAGQKFQQNRRSGPLGSRPGQRGPERPSRNSTRRRA
ncbi:MAG: Pseudouridine synthase [Nitrospira sp.]|nr:MAG: Pseudouridine synthase [Nitrospira sp.]